MKTKTRRQISRVWKDVGFAFGILNIFILVVTVIIAPLLAITGRVFISWILAIIWAVVLITFLLLRIIYPSLKARYYELVDFGERDANTVLKATEGLLNTQKAEPYYVHAAPIPAEVEDICRNLKENQFAKISGSPGSGKSMAAYHAAFILHREKKYQVYRLKVQELENKKTEEFGQIKVNLLLELDGLKGGRKKIVLVDDAHRLPMSNELFNILKEEAKEGNGELVWIETTSPSVDDEAGSRKEDIQLDLAHFMHKLVHEFYLGEETLLQEALKKHTLELQDALDRVHEGKIKDVWHFNFCAAKGWERLASQIAHLNDFDTLVLFFISAHAVISGEQELHINEVVNKIRSLEIEPRFRPHFQWLREYLSVSDAVTGLAGSKLIIVYDKNEHDKGYIASLHYNFARQVTKASLARRHLAKDLVYSAGLLLSDEYSDCEWFVVLHTDMGKHVAEFDEFNKEWLVSFLNAKLPEQMSKCATILRTMKKMAPLVHEDVIKRLDLMAVCGKIGSWQASDLGGLAMLMDSLGDRGGELREKLDLSTMANIANTAQLSEFSALALFTGMLDERAKEFRRKLDLHTIVKRANEAPPCHFGRLAHLISSLKERAKELKEELNLPKLAKAASDAQPGDLVRLGVLIGSLKNTADELKNGLDWIKIAETANSVELVDFHGLAVLIGSLGKQAEKLKQRLNFTKIGSVAANSEVEQFGNLSTLLVALGDQKGKLIEKIGFDALGRRATDAKVEQFGNLSALLVALGDEKGKLIEKIGFDALGRTATDAKVEQFGNLSTLLVALGDEKGKLIEKIGFDALGRTATDAKVEQFGNLSTLLVALGDEKGKLIEKVDLKSLKKSIALIQPKGERELVRSLANSTHLISVIDENQRCELIDVTSWVSFCMQCPIRSEYFNILGLCLENLYKQAEQTIIGKVTAYLSANIDTVKSEVGNAQPNEYGGVAKFLWICNQINHDIAHEVVATAIDGLIERFAVFPWNYRGVGQLINAIHFVDSAVAESLLQDNRVTGQIVYAINRQDWKSKPVDFRHLIKAFYRSAPTLWLAKLGTGAISADLSDVGLSSIYREIEMEESQN